MAKSIAGWKKHNKNRPRVAIVTYGALPIITATHKPDSGDEPEVKEYPIIPLTKEQVVDTNGAGDSFVGGWLAAYQTGQDFDGCMKAGMTLSAAVVQQIGCQFPDKVDF